MDWERYKLLCDQPNVVSRWMLEQTLELLSEDDVAVILRAALTSQALAKPADHRGGEATNMYRLALSPAQRETIAGLVRLARDAEAETSKTTGRGLGGFVEAWDEYLHWQEESFMSNDQSVVLELINAFNTMDLDGVVACFADGAVYHNIPMEAVTGPEAIRGVLQGFMASSSEVQWDLLHIVGDAGVVLTERVDKFKINDTWVALPVMGTFEVTDGKITAWRDYFDLGQFQTQMAAAAGG
jgi:limonene-1,2-epoxide hydrolase